MIDTIITGYLLNNKRIVIPGFGAFIRKDTGDLVFVEFLKKDDHVLTSMLSREYSLEENEAHAAIAEYVSAVRQAVSSSGRYVIEGLGSLYSDSNGLYALASDPSARKETHHSATDERYAATEMEVVTMGEDMPAAEATSETQEKHIIPETIRTAPQFEVTGAPEEIIPEGKTIEMPVKEQLTSDANSEPARAADISARQQTEQRKGITLNDLYSAPKEETPRQPRQQDIRQGQATAQTRPAATPANTPRPAYTQQAEPPKAKPVNYRTTARSKKIDWVMLIAIIAAIIALTSIIVGLFSENSTIKIKPTNPVEVVDEAAASQTDITPVEIE